MTQLRKLLLPFAWLYQAITTVRNNLYFTGVFKRHSFSVPVIAVGNLSTGGTGKTPQIEYLIELLQSRYRVAVLSRGYKRITEGFRLAGEEDTAATLGDEPFQYYRKYPGIQVAVDAHRVRGIRNLLSQPKPPEVILLDDAYQHLKVKAGYYLLLTAYNDLYTDDCLLPAGNLRESQAGAERANLVIVTKCPPQLTEDEQNTIRKKLRLQPHQELFFTAIGYAPEAVGAGETIAVAKLRETPKQLVAGIAKPEPFFEHLRHPEDSLHAFPDHHAFTPEEIHDLQTLDIDRLLITTEKDYVRLLGKIFPHRWFYLPITTTFITRQDQFNQCIITYVESSRSNRTTP